MRTHLRCTEWSRVGNHTLGLDDRLRMDAAVNAWRAANGLPVAPLFFAGTDGQQLCTRQYVGVVEVGDVTLEIFPKLDTLLLAADEQPLGTDATVGTVMSNLMWMLEVAEHRTIVEASTAHVREEPASFFDLFAYLLGRNLLPELQRGVTHSYVAFQENVSSVRGRIDVVTQLTKNWNRYDRLSCRWDEFTPDNHLNRVLKCACLYLRDRVRFPDAMRILADCQALLTDVTDLPPTVALREAATVRFDRGNERFKTSFGLARRLLAGVGHNFGAGDSDTFVFLIDMNELFESYVHAVLESHFEMTVEPQVIAGTLLQLPVGGIRQVADFVWGKAPCIWIGDAKYKHMTEGHDRALRFRDLGDTDGAADVSLAANKLSAADVRQLTVYAELVRLKGASSSPPRLMLLYPFVGDETEAKPDKAYAWNGSEFWLVPVLVRRQLRVGDSIQVVSEARPPVSTQFIVT